MPKTARRKLISFKVQSESVIVHICSPSIPEGKVEKLLQAAGQAGKQSSFKDNLGYIGRHYLNFPWPQRSI